VATAGLIVALCAPALGALADRSNSRKRYLGVFCLTGAVAASTLAFIGPGKWQWASAVFVVATVGFYCANIFYDALLVNVSTKDNRHWVSAIGFSLGYFGSVLLLIIAAILYLRPDLANLPSPESAVKVTFLCVGVWWLIFALPLFLTVKEESTGQSQPLGAVFREAMGETREVARSILEHRQLLWFLLAYWFYIDGVNTIVHLAFGYGTALGVRDVDLLGTIVVVQVIGIPCALLFGSLGQRYGARPFIFAGIFIYIIVTLYAAAIDTEPVRVFGNDVSKFYLLGILIGVAQGGLQSLSRSFFANLIPEKRDAAAYFGFYNLVGKTAAILGPVIMGVTTATTGNPRNGALAIAILFLVGAGFLLAVRSADAG
jgi:UMF1 family MFS transporter